jgi:tRNA-specific 2-thiouridylase
MATAPRILVAMSGGVDSSVAAALLVERGCDVVGVFMRVGNHSPTDDRLPIADRHRGCCSASDAADARRVAGRLGIPFYALNFEDDFSRLIDHFADEYAAARTPNPCVLCNQWLKFGRLLAYADAIGADRVATGHYARLDRASGRPRLRRARFERKDQSYVLFGIAPAARERTIFPLGDLSKDEVRDHARRLGLPVHDKPESQDICFVPDRDYAAVVRARRPDAVRPGEIRHEDGRLLGRHEGVANFTVGQRHGLRVPVGTPVYVTALDPAANVVTVGPANSVRSTTLTASRMSWWIDPPDGPLRADARIRYNHRPASATVTPYGDGRIRVDFDEPQSAITPGQALVLYDGDAVLAGGWIDDRP